MTAPSKQHAAEREILFAHCRHLNIPLWSPPRAPEALNALAGEVDRLRAGIQWARGLCSDEEPYAAIDAYLGGLLR